MDKYKIFGFYERDTGLPQARERMQEGIPAHFTPASALPKRKAENLSPGGMLGMWAGQMGNVGNESTVQSSGCTGWLCPALTSSTTDEGLSALGVMNPASESYCFSEPMCLIIVRKILSCLVKAAEN